MKIIVRLECLLEELYEIEDLRESWKVKHKIGDIIAICLFATLARCDEVKDIFYWAQANEEMLNVYLELPNGIPGYDTIRRVLALTEPSTLNMHLQKWNELVAAGETEKLRKILAIDGKTQRGSATAKAGRFATYLQMFEPDALKKVSRNEYCLKEHGSLRITNGKWHWYSRGFGGKDS